MKRFIPILMMLLLLTGCGAQSSETTYRQISMEEAVTMMEEETEYTSSMYGLLRNIVKSIFQARLILPTNPSAQRTFRSCRIKIS